MLNDNYKLVNLSINDIYLNLENPRFEKINSQDEAIRVMITEYQEKIYNLAKHIIENGINPTEHAAVIKKDGIYIALDGNRRLTTLKILKNPDILDENFERLKSKIMKLDRTNIPDSINAIEFVSEEEAYTWIDLKHTGENDGAGTVSWNSIQQSRFNNEKYPLSIQFLKYMQSANLFDKSLSKSIKDLKITNLERLLTDPDIRETISITRVKNQLHFPVPSSDIKNIFNNLLTELFADDFTVNKIRKKEDRAIFINDFANKYGLTKNTIDNLKKQNTTTLYEYATTKQEKDEDTKPISEPRKSDDSKQDKTTNTNVQKKDEDLTEKPQIQEIPSTMDRKTLIPETFNLSIKNLKINDIYQELKRIPVNQYPNIVGASFRVFLELSVDYYIDENKSEITVRENDKLKNKIQKVKEHIDNKLNLESSVLKDINRAIASNDNLVSIDILHAYIHSGVAQASADGLKTTWNNYQKFFEILFCILNDLPLAKA